MGIGEEELYGFIRENIDTVPHLEALLLLWTCRPKSLEEAVLAGRLFVNRSGCREIVGDLVRHGLVSISPDQPGACGYLSSADNDRLMEALALAYRTDLIRISTLIHAKASAGVREFARAFEFKRKKGKS